MELHEFMCPEVCSQNDWLRANPKAMQSYPSRLLMICDFEADKVHMRPKLGDGIVTRTLSEMSSVEAFIHQRGHRNKELIASLQGRVKSFVIANMRDCSPFSPELYFDRDINILQYNRRKGARSTVLWQLQNYFAPSERIGGLYKRRVHETLTFLDKKPMIVWRGRAHSMNWTSPHSTTSLAGQWEKAQNRGDLENLAEEFSRARAVLYSFQHPEFTDFRFTTPLRNKPPEPDTVGAEYFAPEYPPRTLLESRYQLCVKGHDVASQLYWILGTHSVAFKEETEYEVLPDYFLKPWVHYVPIAPGLRDLREKFEYCEANPDLCCTIIERANEAYERIIQPKLWEEAENIVLDRLGWLA